MAAAGGLTTGATDGTDAAGGFGNGGLTGGDTTVGATTVGVTTGAGGVTGAAEFTFVVDAAGTATAGPAGT